MMENAPSIFISGKILGEKTWIPQNASGWTCATGRTSSASDIFPVAPAAQLQVLVEHQVARGIAILHRQRCQCAAPAMRLQHRVEIDVLMTSTLCT